MYSTEELPQVTLPMDFCGHVSFSPLSAVNGCFSPGFPCGTWAKKNERISVWHGTASVLKELPGNMVQTTLTQVPPYSQFTSHN